MADRSYLEQLSRELADEGKLIEAGWMAMRLAVVRHDAPAEQLEVMRYVFMAGAQHVWASIISILDPGVMETPNDLRRLDLIDAELSAFAKELALRVQKSKGQA